MPNTVLRTNTGAVDTANTEFGRASVTKSDGISYHALWCSDSKIHIFEVSANKATVTDRIQITPSGAEIPQRICLAWNVLTGGLGIAYQSGATVDTANNQIRYAPVNISTWAAPTWESVAGAAGAGVIFSNFDMDISDTGLVVVGIIAVDRTTAGGVNIWCKATTGGAWVNSHGVNFYTSHLGFKSGECVSVICLSATGGARDIMFAANATGTTANVKLYSARTTESTGAALGGVPVLRQSLMTNAFTGTDATNNTTKFVHVKLFKGLTSTTYEFFGMSRSSKILYYHKGTFNSGTWNNVVSESTFTYSSKTWVGMGISYGLSQNGAGGGTFYVRDNLGVVWIKSLNVLGGTTLVWSGGDGRAFPGVSTQTVLTISDNASPFPTVTDQDIVITVNDSVAGTLTTYDSWAGFASGMPGGGTGILSITPANGAVNVVGNAPLSAVVDTDQKYGRGPLQIQWQVAADASFLTSVQTYQQPLASGLYVDGTDTPGVTVTFSDTMPVTLAKGVWFYRAQIMDQWNNVGGWFSGGSFSVGHPPSAVPISPAGGSTIAWNGGITTFTWNFMDPSPGDTQSAYQVQVINNVGTVIADSGKVVSTVKSYTPAALAIGNKDINLTWQVKVWDSQDTPGLYSTPQQFLMTDVPVVTITSPTSGAVLTSGSPTYTFSATTGGSPVRRISGYQVIVTSAGATIYSSPVFPVDLASGTTINFKQPPNYLQNNLSYTVQISATDSAGLVGVSAPIPFTTSWAAPATPGAVTVDISAYDLDGSGYNLVSWPDTGRATGFTHWTVYRQDDLIDPSTGSVLQTGIPVPIYQDYDTGTGYAIRDYMAPANQYQSTYSVTQWINSAGQDIESLKSSAAAVKQQSSAYWLINLSPTSNTASTVRLAIVTDDSYTDEQEEAEFTVIGRGRVVNRGQALGPKGSVTARLRNTGGTTARQKRLNLVNLLKLQGQLLLSNPFGDVWSVNMSNVSVSRIAGVGAMEFCDVTIPYSQVS